MNFIDANNGNNLMMNKEQIGNCRSTVSIVSYDWLVTNGYQGLCNQLSLTNLLGEQLVRERCRRLLLLISKIIN